VSSEISVVAGQLAEAVAVKLVVAMRIPVKNSQQRLAPQRAVAVRQLAEVHDQPGAVVARLAAGDPRMAGDQLVGVAAAENLLVAVSRLVAAVADKVAEETKVVPEDQRPTPPFRVLTLL